jgi:hypothetical protein
LSKRLEELSQLRKAVDPSALQTILLDEICGRLEDLTEKLNAYMAFMGPMAQPFEPELKYQYKTVKAGRHDTVFKLENPSPGRLVGIITEVANDWYPNTVLEWYIDGYPRRVEYIIGNIDNPKEYARGIPFHKRIEWVAWNNDTIDHTFGILCDGFYINKKLYSVITGQLPDSETEEGA